MHKHIYKKKQTQKKVISLTFDDGPDPQNTPQILKILKSNNVKASFFVTGNSAEMYPDLIKEIIEEGHEIGNHTYSHINMILSSSSVIKKEIHKTDKILKELGYTSAIHVRPPYGRFFIHSIFTLLKMGKKIILWNIGPKDFKAKTSEEVIEKTLKKLQPGSIIVLHDGKGDRSKTVEALEKLINQIKSFDYVFRTVSELFDFNLN